MVTCNKQNELFAYINGLYVGKLTKNSSGQLAFQYSDTWLKYELSRPISLSMPLTEITYKGGVVENFLENLLPDNQLIRNRIQSLFHSKSTKCFDLLSDIGGDCVGALQLLASPITKSVKCIQATSISDTEITNLLKNYLQAPLGMDSENDFRISIAGAQEKTALLWH